MLYCESCRPIWVPRQNTARRWATCEACGTSNVSCQGLPAGESVAAGYLRGWDKGGRPGKSMQTVYTLSSSCHVRGEDDWKPVVAV